MIRPAGSGGAEFTVGAKLQQISWAFVVFVVALGCFGFAMLYSAANGSPDPWMSRQVARFAVGLVVMLAVAVMDLKIFLRYAYWVYLATLAALVYVEVAGEIGMGAQRWIDLGVFQLQPSEVMKVALVLALARYFHGLDHEEVSRPWRLLAPMALILMPTALVMIQPDLGTAGMLLMVGTIMFFAAGVRLWKFAVVGAAGIGAIPLAWGFLREYQKNWILTFLDPESDPLGTGYHIHQSKIAFGSGGMFGKGFMQGTQSHLNFLPERQTDFIFTMLAEELGLLGSLGLLGLYVAILVFGFFVALRSRSYFGRLLAIGLTGNLFCYVFINMAMVMGLIPVVGVPLPLMSYGGTAMLTVLTGFGLLLCAHVHRDQKIGPAAYDD